MTDYRYHRTDTARSFPLYRAAPTEEAHSPLIEGTFVLVPRVVGLAMPTNEIHCDRQLQKRNNGNIVQDDASLSRSLSLGDGTRADDRQVTNCRHRYQQLHRFCQTARQKQLTLELLDERLLQSRLYHGLLEAQLGELQLKKHRFTDNDKEGGPKEPLNRMADMLLQKDCEIDLLSKKIDEDLRQHNQAIVSQEATIAESVKLLTFCDSRLSQRQKQIEKAANESSLLSERHTLKSSVEHIEESLRQTTERLNCQKLQSARLIALLKRRNVQSPRHNKHSPLKYSKIKRRFAQPCCSQPATQIKLAQRLQELRTRVVYIEREEEKKIQQRIYQLTQKYDTIMNSDNYKNLVKQQGVKSAELRAFLRSQQQECERIEHEKKEFKAQLENNQKVREKLKKSMDKMSKNFPDALFGQVEAEQTNSHRKKQQCEQLRLLLRLQRQQLEELMVEESQLCQQLDEFSNAQAESHQSDLTELQESIRAISKELEEYQHKKRMVEIQTKSLVPQIVMAEIEGKVAKEQEQLCVVQQYRRYNVELVAKLSSLKSQLSDLEWNNSQQISDIQAGICSLKGKVESLEKENKDMKRKNWQGLTKINQFQAVFERSASEKGSMTLIPIDASPSNLTEESAACKDRNIKQCQFDQQLYPQRSKAKHQNNSNRRKNCTADETESDESVLQLLKAHSRNKGSRAMCSKNIQNQLRQYNIKMKKLNQESEEVKPQRPAFHWGFVLAVVGVVILILKVALLDRS